MVKEEFNSLDIVRYVPSDLDSIMEIELDSFAAPWSRQSYEELAPLDTVDIWVVKNAGEVLGYMLFQHAGEEMELHTIAVKETHRKKGIAKKMIEHMFEKAREYGTKRVFLQVRPSNIPARNLYAGFGFVSVGIRKAYYHDNGEDAMALRLEIGGKGEARSMKQEA